MLHRLLTGLLCLLSLLLGGLTLLGYRQLGARLSAQEQALAQLRRERAAERARPDVAPVPADRAVLQAGANYCAAELARDLEDVRQNIGRYPTPDLIALPGACQDFRVQWQALSAKNYRFVVLGAGGERLAGEQR